MRRWIGQMTTSAVNIDCEDASRAVQLPSRVPFDCGLILSRIASLNPSGNIHFFPAYSSRDFTRNRFTAVSTKPADGLMSDERAKEQKANF
jgi:hypothetical protein